MPIRALRLIVIVLLIAPAVTSGQGAPGVTVPAGFRAERLLQFNECPDPQRIAFLPSGDLLVASMTWRVCQVDAATGAVSTRAKFLLNNGPNPFDILALPDGKIYFTSNPLNAPNATGIFRLDASQAVRVTPDGWIPTYFTPDGSGGFYVAVSGPAGFRGVARFTDEDGDGTFETVQPLIYRAAYGLVFRDGVLYVVHRGGGRISMYQPDGTPIGQLIGGLVSPTDLAVDSSGNLYTAVYAGQVPDGYVSYDTFEVVKIHADGAKEQVVPAIKGEGISIGVSPEDVLYVSDFDRGVVSKMVGGTKVDVTRDTGLNSITEPGFDLFNRLYFSSFRYSRLYRVDPEARTFEPFAGALGCCTQSIAFTKGGKLLLSSYWWDSDGNEYTPLFRVDPVAGSVDQQPMDGWSRTIRFDAYGRLVLVQASIVHDQPSGDIDTTLGVFDGTSPIAPYVTGNDLMRFLFDDQQNLYARHRRWQGLIKVNIPKDPTVPPVPVDSAPLFYDLRSKGSEIRYFDLNARGQMLIPLPDAGEVVLGQPDGSWGDFAKGFDWPGYARFDRNGVLYVVSSDSLYRIIGRDFVLPGVSRRLREIQADLGTVVKDKGLLTSLTQQLANIVSSVGKGNVKPAVNQIDAFVALVTAQRGKKIDATTADTIVGIVQSIKSGLKLL